MNDHGIGNWPTIHAVRTPDRVALVDGETGATLTYRELDQRVSQLADALAQRGVRRGDRVATLTLNSPQMLEVLFAVARLGAVTVPVNFRLSTDEVRYVLKDSGAVVLFHSTQTSEVASEAADGTRARDLFEIPSAERRNVGDSSPYEALVASGDARRMEYDVDGADLCVLMYTSGTTGSPKGTMLTHDNFLWNAIQNVTLGDGLSRNDVNLVAAPLFHIGGMGIFTLPLLYIGGSSVILESFTPQAWADAVAAHQVTTAFLVPAMWAAITKLADLAGHDLASLRIVLSGGAPCPLVVIEALLDRGLTFIEGFGLTETAPFATYLDADAVVERAGSIGRPVNHVQVRIVDDAGQDLPDGEVGEFLVRGPNVFIGYWGRPEASREALRDGWFHTGDLARRDDGYYTLVDRKKDMVITGGENVYPVEVEQSMFRHPGIDDVAVIGVPDEKWGETVVAIVVRKEGVDFTADELIDWVRARLAHFKCPQRVEFIDELPRTATGKVLKRELRRLQGNESAVSR